MAKETNGKSGILLARLTVVLLTASVGLLSFLSQQVYSGTIERREMKVRSEMNDAALLEKVSDLQSRVSCIQEKISGKIARHSVPTAGGD